MNISRRKSEWVGVQESKVRGSCNTWHLSSIEHPLQGSISTQDWACCLERPSECAECVHIMYTRAVEN